MASTKGKTMTTAEQVTKKAAICEKHKEKAGNDPARRLAVKGLKRAQRRLARETTAEKMQEARAKKKKESA